MKYIKFFSLVLFCALISTTSCGDKKAEDRKQQARESLGNPIPPASPNAAIPPPPGQEPAQNAEGVWHYICNNGCAGGAGAKGNCPTCGSALAHNAAYHSNSNATTTTSATPVTTQVDPPINPPTTPPITPPSPEPAQNAAGVWHYTCAKGCAGGSGAKGTCATCGGALAHNAAYHQ